MKVVHCKKEAYDIYIGRPSIWGNPFVLTNPKDEKERDEVYDKFEDWLNGDYNGPFDKQREVILKNIHTLKGKVLGCWCAPRKCHGDILLRIANHGLKKQMTVQKL